MSTTIVARTGRYRQRYDNSLRLVSGLLNDNEENSIELQSRVEVLMISSPNRDDLVFPKGGWEDDETVEEAACREALEEAGVRGNIKGNHLGVWEFRSKSKQDLCSTEGGCKGYMFALEVTEELNVWPEQGNRDRKWLLAKDAFKLCRYEWMCRALEEFLRVMAGKDEMREEALEPHPLPVSDVIAECQIMSTNCHLESSGAQHHLNACPMGTTFEIMIPSIFL